MKKNQSPIDNSISQHYFAVYPIFLTINKPHPSRFSLYFEKSLQIIAKHADTSLGTLRSFPPPQQIHHFRMVSDKLMDYQWSLYKQVDPEDFIETQKISLKTHWTNYLENQQTITEAEVEFKTIKSRLKYLIVIGKNNQELLRKITTYFQSTNTYVEHEKIVPEISEEKVENIIVEKNPEEINQGILTNLQEANRVTEENAPYVENDLKRVNLPRIKQLISPEPLLKQDNKEEDNLEERIQQIEQEQNDQAQQDLKLSQSEQEISKIIEKDINQYEQQVSQSIKIHKQNHTNKKPTKKTVLEPSSNPINEIPITHSQLLNSKQQIIPSPWKNPKYVIAVVIIIFLAGLGVFSFTKGKNIDKVHKATKKAYEKTQSKKQQSKGIKKQVKNDRKATTKSK